MQKNANYAENMQKLCRNYAEIMQKLCRNYANIMHIMHIINIPSIIGIINTNIQLCLETLVGSRNQPRFQLHMTIRSKLRGQKGKSASAFCPFVQSRASWWRRLASESIGKHGSEALISRRSRYRVMLLHN